jgi:CRP-like cAMP-binding protein
MNEELRTAIARAPLFRRLREEDRARVEAVARLRPFDKGDVLFAEGDHPATFLVVVSGRVKIARATPSGRQVILEFFGPGDPLGAVAVFEGFPYPATATAVEPGVCVSIERSAFLGLLGHHNSLVLGLLSGLSMRLVELAQRAVELAGGRVEQRLAQVFVRLAAERGKAVPDGTFIPQPLSRQELADLCGTTLETTIRVMSRWGKEGVIETRTDGFLIRDAGALGRAAGL